MTTDQNPQHDDEALFFTSKLSLNDRHLRTRRRSDWVEDSFISYSDEQLSRSNKQYLGLGISKTALTFFSVIILISLGMLLTRAGYLQLIRGAAYAHDAEINRLRQYFVTAPRGLLYDRNGTLLVANVPSFSLYVTPVDFPQDEAERERLIAVLKNYFPEQAVETESGIRKILAISKLRKEYYQPHAIVNNIDYERAVHVRVESALIPGVMIEVDQQRRYITDTRPNLISLSHILGYVGKITEDEFSDLQIKGYLYRDVVGKTGIEARYETALRGKYGTRQVEVNSQGKEIKEISRDPVTKGQNVVLTIDLAMQQKMEELLSKELTALNLRRGVGIVEDPRNGEILAMVSLPAYDNNEFAHGIDNATYTALLNDKDNPLFNRSISGEFPSGSVIKPIFAAAALQEKIITTATTFVSTGGIRIGEWFFPDWSAGGHGVTDVRKAIAMSVNTFFYIIGGGYEGFEGLGPNRMKQYGELFGLSSVLGIDLPNEKSGFLPSPEWKKEEKNEPWYIGDTYHMAIGQGDVLVTPLQVSNYIAVFANGGTLYQPHLMRATVSSGSTTYEPIEPKAIHKDFIDSYVMSVVRSALRQTVTAGSAASLQSLPVTAAGKTGTAQWAPDKKPHAWFTAFAPYEKPEIVVTVLIEEGEEGSRVSVPVVRDFMQWYFTRQK